MKTLVYLRLYLRSGKATKLGKQSINCKITVHGRAVTLSSGITVEPKEWCPTRKKVLGNTPAARTANQSLTKLIDGLTDLIADLERQGKPVTAQGLARLYRNGGKRLITFKALGDAFFAERKGLVGVEIKNRTSVGEKMRLKNLRAFLAANRLSDMLPEEFTHNMGDKYLHWLIQTKNFKRNTANKNVGTVFQVLRWGVRREYLEKNPMELYQYKHTPPGEIKYLNAVELLALTTTEMPARCLDRARDCFVLQCWTGLAYADLFALNVPANAEYHRDKSGGTRRVLRLMRQKSTMEKGYECVIPLLPEAERILAKYADWMPVPTNQAYNRFLKEIGQLCGIEADKMTSHVGRKTAGTLLLNRGIPLPVVSKFLGHANTNITEKLYAKLLDTTVVDSFTLVFGEAATGPLEVPQYAEEEEETTKAALTPKLVARPARRVPAALLMGAVIGKGAAQC